MPVTHGVVEVFAYQETLLIMAVFGIAILVMIWVGFRRWLQHKEQTTWLIAEQTAERAAQYGAHMKRVEERLKAVEQIVTDGGVQPPAQVETLGTTPLPDPSKKRDEV
jgi:uncharacterized iron-regulated membrane protein